MSEIDETLERYLRYRMSDFKQAGGYETGDVFALHWRELDAAAVGAGLDGEELESRFEELKGELWKGQYDTKDQTISAWDIVYIHWVKDAS